MGLALKLKGAGKSTIETIIYNQVRLDTKLPSTTFTVASRLRVREQGPGSGLGGEGHLHELHGERQLLHGGREVLELVEAHEERSVGRGAPALRVRALVRVP